MKSIEIAGLRFGEGLPKICVPLVGGGGPALLNEIAAVKGLPADLFEWRADHFYGGFKLGLEALQGLEKPVLCTLRTVREGGKADLTPAEYEEKVSELLDLSGFQLVDIELACGEERVCRLMVKAREKGVGVVVSKHDFAKTPPENEIYETLKTMHALGADLPKMAVMPRSPEDVLHLLSATLRASRELGPVITMAMGNLGKVSRVSGQVFGSCMTFGAGQDASAPGQVNAEDLRAIMEDLAY